MQLTKTMNHIPIKTILVFIILFSNWSGFKEITAINKGYYRYSNLSGSMTTYEILSQDRLLAKESAFGKGDWSMLKSKYPGTTDTLTYRLFKINPLKFWRWYEYIFNWRYKLPYTDWDQIKKRRGYGNLKYANGLQEF